MAKEKEETRYKVVNVPVEFNPAIEDSKAIDEEDRVLTIYRALTQVLNDLQEIKKAVGG